ncbi:hypothetical protein CALVIDRAFT_301773 [Calocera viscosa TUFC12733]|uniref:F-box domain-containing protein n=1 Tax=Calocera viscosa (strain TUFC12733) TaxID=1330018 RepID=A0A167IK34_CALVF|nr:hypothetical protein CALVIDRAFT_301773 [Calocera viscosa TUFC12733]
MSSQPTRIRQLQNALTAGNAFKIALAAVETLHPTTGRSCHDTDADTVQILDDVKRLKNDLQSLMQQINETRNVLLSPIYRLHDDVLQDIFLMCTVVQPWKLVMQPEVVAQDTMDSISIAQVSRRWRNVALRSPAMWTNIELGPITWPQTLLSENPWHPGVLEEEGLRLQNWSRNETFLERSKKAALYIKLEYRGPLEEQVSDLFSKANEHRTGPRFVQLDRDRLHPMDTNGTPRTFRCLEAVRDRAEYLSIDSSHQSGDFYSFVRSIICTPLSILEGLRLEGFHLPTKLMPESEYLNCRFLRLDWMTTTSALRLLSACPRLQEMVICVENSGRHLEDVHISVVELPSLRECSIKGKGGDFERLLIAIRAPTLHTLKCQARIWAETSSKENRRQDYEQISTTLRSFASTSGYSLQALSLTNLPLRFFPEILAVFPSLRSPPIFGERAQV